MDFFFPLFLVEISHSRSRDSFFPLKFSPPPTPHPLRGGNALPSLWRHLSNGMAADSRTHIPSKRKTSSLLGRWTWPGEKLAARVTASGEAGSEESLLIGLFRIRTLLVFPT